MIAARLAFGPINLAWLIPYVQSAISNHNAEVNIRLQQADLAWRDLAEGPVLTLGNVDANATDGRFALHMAALSGSISVASLISGTPVPSRLSASGIRLAVQLPAASGAGAPPVEAPQDEPAAIARLLDTSPLRFIDALSINDAEVTLARAPDDVLWRGTITTLGLLRRGSGLEGDASITFDQQETPGSAKLAVRSDTTTAITNAVLLFNNIRPNTMAPLAATLAPLALIDMPLSGTATAVIGADGALQTVTVEAASQTGQFALTPALAKHFGIADAAQTIPIQSLSLQVSGQPAVESWTLQSLQLRLPETAMVSLPAPVNRSIPLRSIDAQASYDKGRLVVPMLDIALDGPRLRANAEIADLAGATSGRLDLQMLDLTVPLVRAYWPPQMAADAYEWVNTHLVAGTVQQATMQMSFGPDNGATAVTALQLTIPVEGAVVDYLPPLPAVREARAVVGLNLKTLTVDLQHALVDGMTISNGSVVIAGIDADNQTIAIDFNAQGAASDLVRLLETTPLDFLDPENFRPDAAGGRFEARVELNFPLREDLDADEMKVAVSAITNGVSIALPPPIDIALSEGNLRFAVTERSLEAVGTLAINGVRGTLDWVEDFRPATPLQRRIDFRADHVSVAAVRKGLEHTIDLSPYLDGGRFDADLHYKERDDGNASVEANLDLTHAAVAIPQLSWQKPAGKATLLQVQAALFGGKLQALRSIRLAGVDANVQGWALFTDAGQLESLRLDPFILGRSQLTAMVDNMNGSGWDITLTGKSLDLAPFLEGGSQSSAKSDAAQPAAKVPNLLISADLQQTWIGSDQSLQGLLVSAKRTDGKWQFATARGATENGAPFSLDMRPAEGDLSTISFAAEDVGGTLAAFDIYPDMRGGRLTGTATGIVSTDNIQLAGELRVNRFHLVRAPVLARMLDLLAITGLRDVLSGRGIGFTSLRASFAINNGVIELRSARASGSTLGMTGSGTVDLGRSTVEMSGTLIPFFWANNALGNLPLIGGWLTGGEDGGGVFSATYQLSGQLDDPKMQVNPYSIVLPSIIRYILELIQSWVGPSNNAQQMLPENSP